VLASPQGGANYKAAEIDALPTPRTLSGIAELAPGLTDNTPNAGQVTIAGGFAYDNVFLVDGVDVNDNLFGDPDNLFIEDAIEETQVLTSGISAEYGRFTGGVVNAITKKGGDIFSGSFRVNLTNPAWTDHHQHHGPDRLHLRLDAEHRQQRAYGRRRARLHDSSRYALHADGLRRRPGRRPADLHMGTVRRGRHTAANRLGRPCRRPHLPIGDANRGRCWCRISPVRRQS
jgi:outer membrane receptor protein involved in Fe transport